MLLKKQSKLTLHPPMPKIIALSTAFDGTFVLLRLDRINEQQSIVHLDSYGKILWEKAYHFPLNCFGMMSDREVIILNVQKGLIEIINLQTKNVFELKHDFIVEETVFTTIETFSETNLFCIVEKGGIGNHQLRLTYFDYSRVFEISEPLTQWNSGQNEWTYDHTTCRLNNHSKIGWWMYRHEKTIQFSFFDLRQEPKGRLTMIKVENSIGKDYGLNNIELDISNLWQSLPNQYMIMGLSTKIQHPKICKNSKEVINNNFIIDASEGKQEALIREVNFFFENDASGYSLSDHLVDCCGLGSFSIFPTFKNQHGNTLESPIFYVFNETEKIVAKDTWKCSSNSANYYFPGWDGSTMIQSQHRNADCQQVKVTTRKLISIKEISLHFLLHIYDDFDDDLLLDATKLLQNSYSCSI